MRPIACLLACLALALPCGGASAAPKDDLHAAFAKFLKVRSFRVAPDRYRMNSADGASQLIIGDAMYMDMDGQLMRVPVPGVRKLTAQYRNEDALREMEGNMAVQALPDATVDGETARAYAYSVTEPVKAEVKTWISVKTGLPIQVESSGRFMGIKSTTRVRYSDFDDPSIRIEAP
jgi:hypothetical protein